MTETKYGLIHYDNNKDLLKTKNMSILSKDVIKKLRKIIKDNPKGLISIVISTDT